MVRYFHSFELLWHQLPISPNFIAESGNIHGKQDYYDHDGIDHDNHDDPNDHDDHDYHDDRDYGHDHDDGYEDHDDHNGHDGPDDDHDCHDSMTFMCPDVHNDHGYHYYYDDKDKQLSCDNKLQSNII